ncbi:hypothetical protein NNJEOMEG_01374 [Fundidesulfovibrio magnetotacticus]|uniref:TNase-like domain-containing protein n=1 Tax=Fundidesulfovibrio magnetotacticus TaxID=2730080 RepID=A0A6V8LRD9_9BACT|nr:thermonuclease family protein [Fundidesulfovibrio magnetotacticus]GFK93540.1 hypothetical protein NNJEOMEG_01374 [Fundidesulfovibrio magnetotacticus]
MKTRLAAVFLLSVVAAQAWAFSGRVSNVHDGDTITVDGTRVRLYGIDAPELAQPGGHASRDFLASLVEGRSVEVKVVDTDAYGRKVGLVRAPGADDVNAAMVKAGHAWVYRKYCQNCYAMLLAEKLARYRSLGLWDEPGKPVPPWVWRKRHGRTR